MMLIMMTGCESGIDTSETSNSSTTYNVADGGKVVIFDVEGDVTGCYDLDLNGSECTVETNFEGTYELTQEQIEGLEEAI